MEHNRNNQKHISSFRLKQQFISLLRSEFEKCGFNIVLGFESSFRERICTIQFADGKQIHVCINLDYVKKAVDVIGFPFRLKVYYCAAFVAEYIKQIERVKSCVPQNYFEGLVFLNAIEVYKAKKVVSIYSPLSLWNKKPKRTYCIRPLEICSAVNSLNRLRLFTSQELNEQDKERIKAFMDGLLLYSALPEVAYIHTRVPVYTMVDSIKRLAELIEKEPEVVKEFPILTLAQFEQIKQLTVRSLFFSCTQSDNEFLIGVAIRLIAFMQLSYDTEFEQWGQEKLIDALNQYIGYSITYYNELSKASSYFIKDNLLAIKAAVKAINDYLVMYGTGVIAGNIHSIL